MIYLINISIDAVYSRICKLKPKLWSINQVSCAVNSGLPIVVCVLFSAKWRPMYYSLLPTAW